MHETLARAPRPALWPRSTSLFLLLVGSVLSVLSFIIVLNMPELVWPAAQDAELRATYDAYRQTGVLLVAQEAQAGGESLVPAVAHDAPGVYVLASLLGALTGSASPYPALAFAMAVLIAVPLIWLPTAVARIMTRARAGYALIVLPAVLWLVNQGTVLLGTEYGLAPAEDAARVSSLHGIPASLAFLSLALILLCSTYALRLAGLLGFTVLIGVLAGVGELMSALSGVGAALSIGVLWFLNSRRRWLSAFGGAALALAIALLTSVAVSGALDQLRGPEVASASAPPRSPAMWHDFAVGLSFGREATVEEGVAAAESELEDRLAAVGSGVERGSDEYDALAREHYVSAIETEPTGTARLYLEKLLYVVKQFGAMIAFILVSFIIALTRRSPQRRLLGASIAIAAPTLILGLGVAVATSPTLERFGLLAASLGLLTAVGLGALVWSLTSMPSHVRATERSRLSKRIPPLPARDPRSHTSVIVPTRNGETAIGGTIDALAGRLGHGDEIIVVENGSTDDTTAVLDRIRAAWTAECDLVILHSGAGLGEALRTGVIASTGQWLLLTADDLPFGFTDFDQFRKLPGAVVVAIGSKAHPASEVVRSRRRVIQSRIFRFLREALLQSKVGDSQGTFWVDGEWARAFAMLSRETGLMWTTELVLAAEQQGLAVVEVPVSLSDAHETGSSRFRLGDAWRSVIGFTRLAIYKDDYANEVWTRTPTAETEESPAV